MGNRMIRLSAMLLWMLVGCTGSNSDLAERLTFTGSVDSYGDFFVHQLLSAEDVKTSLNIRGAGREALNLSEEVSAFVLPNEDLTIDIIQWDLSVENFFSNDAIEEGMVPSELESWDAISGLVKISVSNMEEVQAGIVYNITLELENVRFENGDGEQKLIPYLLIEDAFVGWLPG